MADMIEVEKDDLAALVLAVATGINWRAAPSSQWAAALQINYWSREGEILFSRQISTDRLFQMADDSGIGPLVLSLATKEG